MYLCLKNYLLHFIVFNCSPGLHEPERFYMLKRICLPDAIQYDKFNIQAFQCTLYRSFLFSVTLNSATYHIPTTQPHKDISFIIYSRTCACARTSSACVWFKENLNSLESANLVGSCCQRMNCTGNYNWVVLYSMRVYSVENVLGMGH